MKTRRLAAPWPFLFSVTERGLVQNLPPAKKRQPRTRLKRIPPSNQWAQENLI